MERLIEFTRRMAGIKGGALDTAGSGCHHLSLPGVDGRQYTEDREAALGDENLRLFGLEDRLIGAWMAEAKSLPAAGRALRGTFGKDVPAGLLTYWQVSVLGARGRTDNLVLPIAVGTDGARLPALERVARSTGVRGIQPLANGETAGSDLLARLLDTTQRVLLHRELQHRGLLSDGAAYSSRLLALVVHQSAGPHS
jgi:hypothetical protein